MTAILFVAVTIVFSVMFFNGLSDWNLSIRDFILIFIVVFIIASPIVYVARYEHIGTLEAFNDATLKAYTYTIDESENIHIKFSESNSIATLLDAGKLTYLELSKEVSERIKELRDEVKEYNNTIALYNRMNRHPILGLFYPELPERLKYIILE